MMLNVALNLFISFGLQASLSAEKVSLQQFCRSFKQEGEITQVFKDSANLEKSPEKVARKFIKENKKEQEALRTLFRQSSSFVRGEIEDEKTINCVIHRLQLSMLEARTAAFQKDWKKTQQIFADWFLFAADFPYEESSLVGLRFSGVMRSLLLDDLEKIQKKFSAEIATNSELRSWFLGIRAPWPVDRVLVTEAKRLLKPVMMPVAQAAAASYQKSPYQTTEQALKKVKGGDSAEAELLKQIWKEADISLMKTEMNRIGSLKLRFAQADYQARQGKPAANVNDLIKSGLLDSAPVDYFTGQPLGLTSL